MADFAESDVTMTITRKEDLNGLKMYFGTMLITGGAPTYNTGGIPLSKGKFGGAKEILDVIFTASTLMYRAEYDKTNSLVKIMYSDLSSGTDAPDIEVADTTALATMTFRFIVYAI